MQSNEYVRVYKCLCDLTRLRILGLLLDGPLCVCHIQGILRAPQPKVSRQLTLMKKSGLLESSRENNWNIYRIASEATPVLISNLKCLQDAQHEDPVFRRDQEARRKVLARLMKTGECLPLAMAQPRAGSAVLSCGGSRGCASFEKQSSVSVKKRK